MMAAAPYAAPRAQVLRARVSLGRVLVPFLVLLYAASLLLAFAGPLQKFYSYTGYYFTPPESVISWVAILTAVMIPALMLPVSYDRPSRLVLWIFYVVVYVPACIVPPFTEGELGKYGVFLLALCTCFALLVLITELPALKWRPISIPISWFIMGIGGFTILTMVLSLMFYGIPTSIPGLGDVYERRLALRSTSDSAPGLLAYFSSWQYKIINPLILLYGLHLQRKSLIFLGVAGQLYYYSVSGHKSILFSLLLVAGVWFVYRYLRQHAGTLVLIGTSVFVLLASLLALVGQIMPFSIGVRRLLFVPGTLTGQYVEFFSEFGFTKNLDPVTRMLFPYPYDRPVPYLIGHFYSGSETQAADANFWASSYAAAGILGMVLVTLALGIILWVINVMTEGQVQSVASVLVVLATFSLTNSELFTTIGTHGLGIVLILMLVRPANNHDDQIDGSLEPPAQQEPGTSPI